MRTECPKLLSEELVTLSSTPDHRLYVYFGCIVNEIRFLIETVDVNRKIQNSSIFVDRENDGTVIDFFGVLTEVIELHYSSV